MTFASDTPTIRSRVKRDLEALRQQYLSSSTMIIENAGTDYRFRGKASHSDISRAIAQLVQELKYDNFKDEVARMQGKDRPVFTTKYGAFARPITSPKFL